MIMGYRRDGGRDIRTLTIILYLFGRQPTRLTPLDIAPSIYNLGFELLALQGIKFPWH